MGTYGRKTIKIDLTEQELLSMDINTRIQTILSFMDIIVNIHEENKADTQSLWSYYYGKQDILEKVKKTRTNINNKDVENWVYALIDFKKAWLLGSPIQYTMLDSSASEEIDKLNKYCSYEKKQSKDQDLYEDVLVAGRGYRYIQKDSFKEEDDEAPFTIININNDSCEVIYSSQIGNEQLFSLIETPMEDVFINSKGELETYYYSDFDIYLRDMRISISNKTGEYVVKKVVPIILKMHLIEEYYINKARISLIEIGRDISNGINLLESLDLDDMEQFVNAIMVFTNADIDNKGLEEIQEYGAVKIKSTENRKASVSLLQQRLNANDTQVLYMRLLHALHCIYGVPMQSDNGSVVSGETGRAKLTGQGFTSAGIRIQNDETKFKDCDKNMLKVILKICREQNNSEINKLKISDIDVQIDMDKSENLLVKAQALQTLLNARIPKKYAIPVVNLFNDTTAVIKDMEEEIEKEKEEYTNENYSNINDEINKQNNIISKTIERDIQQK